MASTQEATTTDEALVKLIAVPWRGRMTGSEVRHRGSGHLVCMCRLYEKERSRGSRPPETRRAVGGRKQQRKAARIACHDGGEEEAEASWAVGL